MIWILGIDPGLKGAFTVRDLEGTFFNFYEMPVVGSEINIVGIRDLIREIIREAKLNDARLKAYVEKVSSRPGNAAQAMVKFGTGFGVILGVLVCNDIALVLVPPQTWSKELHQGVDGKLEAKKKSHIAAQRLFPSVNLKRTPKCKKDDEGYIDSLLLAEFGARKERGHV